MKYASSVLLVAFAATNVFAHGVIDSVQGANGVTLPGLSLIDGTPRDCASPRCGSEADTSIIRDRELGTNRASALGRTQGGGPVDAAAMVQTFMNGAGGNTTAVQQARAVHEANMARRNVNIGARQNGKGSKTPKGTAETGVKAATGMAASQGMPTTADDGTIKMTFHQVNQDGAGPLKADVDGTSGECPGIGFGGLSGASTMDFNVAVKMPAGMTCEANVGGASNVCIARLRNAALAGPFGGSVAFTQSATARKRAVEFKLRKRTEARAFKA
ncbi:cell surface protein [Colletotrichum higginsianum]|nr:cell surface protein [Colletotrichum higginsianum]